MKVVYDRPVQRPVPGSLCSVPLCTSTATHWDRGVGWFRYDPILQRLSNAGAHYRCEAHLVDPRRYFEITKEPKDPA